MEMFRGRTEKTDVRDLLDLDSSSEIESVKASDKDELDVSPDVVDATPRADFDKESGPLPKLVRLCGGAVYY